MTELSVTVALPQLNKQQKTPHNSGGEKHASRTGSEGRNRKNAQVDVRIDRKILTPSTPWEMPHIVLDRAAAVAEKEQRFLNKWGENGTRMISLSKAHIRSHKRNRSTRLSTATHGFLREVSSKRLKEDDVADTHLRRRSHSGADVVQECIQHSAVLPHARRKRSKSVPVCVGVGEMGREMPPSVKNTASPVSRDHPISTSEVLPPVIQPDPELTLDIPQTAAQNYLPEEPVPVPAMSQPLDYNLDMSGTSLERMSIGADVVQTEYSGSSAKLTQSKTQRTTPPTTGPVSPVIVSPELPSTHVHVLLDADTAAKPRLFMSARSTSSVFRNRFVAGRTEQAGPQAVRSTHRPSTQVGHSRPRVGANGHGHAIGRVRPSTQIPGQRLGLSYSRNLSALGPNGLAGNCSANGDEFFDDADKLNPDTLIAPIGDASTHPRTSVKDFGMNVLSYGVL
eukprot:m.311508 g.311508  ORF g.311508 m.311508 type:complete len:452 (-) comp20224_c0_seq2:263-1618(-)